MAIRKSEWLASIKPILDREEIKNDAKELAKELSDILEFKVTDADSLEQLTKEFNKQLVNMGKQQIVFSEKTLQGIVTQFASAIAAGFSKGADIGIQESLKALQAERAQFVAQQKQLQAQKQKFKKIQEWTYDIEDMEDNEFHFFNSDEIDSMKKEAKNIGISFDDYVLKIKQEVEKLQYSLGKMEKGKIPWDNDVITKFYERSNDMFRMSRTLSKNPDIVQDKEILGDYDFANLKYMFAEDLFAHAADFDRVVNGIYNSLNEVSIEIEKIDTKLQTMGEQSGTIVNNQDLKDGLKTIQEIEDAYERILTKDKNRPQRPDQKKVQNMQKALEWQPTGTKKDEGIKVVSQQYQSAKATGDWVQEYEALLKYIRLYESYLKSENKTHRNKVTKPGNDFTKLYNQLKPMYENAQNALRNLVNKATNQQLVGIGGVGGEVSGTTPEDVANADKVAEAEKLAREEAEKKEKTEIEALEVTKQRRVEEEKTSEAIEKQNKLLLYRRVEGDLDPNRISSRSADALYDKQNKPTIQNALESEFGGFGDGLYASPLSGAQDLVPLLDDGKTTFFEFDASGYNFYINKTVEQAEILRGFLSSLQKLVGAGTILDASKLTKIEDLNEEELFKIAQRIFENFSMTKEQFHAWLEGAKQESERIANLFAKGQVPEDRHNFGTRFMKTLGYEGVLNVTGEEDYDGNYQGSVIYDPDIAKIKESMLVFKSTAEYLEHLRISAQNAEQAVNSLNNDIKETKEISQGSGNVTGIDDDSETIAKENGALEDKLELLRDIADQYAANITQKQRDRYEELNQKDMDTGLSAKEEELYYDLGEQIDAADSALEEFGQTYDKIILKLENGKKVEILPDDKGLRSLYKFADEYGETYGGVEIEDVIFERVKQEANAHQENTTAIKNEMKAQEELNNVKGQSSGAGDASSADVDAAKAEAEKQRFEKERIEAEKIAIQQENEAKLKAEADAKAKLQADLAAANQQLTDAQEAKVLADANTRKVEDESRVKDGIIQGLREQLAQVQSGEGSAKVSIGVEELKNVLSAITYNVKVVQDTDNTDSKVAIDEASLEATLNKVFANILNPQTRQNDGEPDNAPWALESTLQAVKGVLDNIQTNTAKIGTEPQQATVSDVGNVLATENTLAAIKTAVEAINTKVVKGTKARTSGGSSKKSSKKTGVSKKNAESYAGSQYFPEKIKTQTMYLAKFRAQLMSTGKLTDDIDAQIYQLLDGLKQIKNGPDFSKWNQQFLQLKTSVGITDIFEGAEDKEVTASYKEIIEFQKIRNKLELEYEKAEDGSALKQFYAEQLAQMDSTIAKQQTILDNEEYEAKLAKMRAEQARKLGELEAKATDKDAKKKAANDKKMAQREAMLGKAGNAVGRAENTWMQAMSIDGELPADFVTQIDSYYQKLDELRKKYQELKNSDIISEDQKKDLIAQTANINKMTDEIGELVAEYQRLSGDNATVIGQNTLGADAGLGAYEQQFKQTVMAATNGKAQIKSFDAATKTLTYTVKTGKNEFTEYTAAVRRADGALVSVRGTTKRTETFFEATARKMKELTSYFSGMAIFSRIGQELRRGIQYVREIDLALTELKKVTDETEETYDKFLQTAAKTANKVGSTIKDVISSTADWARLGYTIKEAAQLAESTQILMNVSEFTDVSQATDTLISAVQAFGYTADTSMEVVDLLNTIGKIIAYR